MINATKKYFQNYLNFKGRTSRADFWWAALGIFVLTFIIVLISSLIFGPTTEFDSTAAAGEALKDYFSNTANIVSFIWTLILVIPSIAISVKRLHDINKTGWLYLLVFVPLIGEIILFIFYLMPSVNEGNSY